jgi:hypothetical protein
MRTIFTMAKSFSEVLTVWLVSLHTVVRRMIWWGLCDSDRSTRPHRIMVVVSSSYHHISTHTILKCSSCLVKMRKDIFRVLY